MRIANRLALLSALFAVAAVVQASPAAANLPPAYHERNQLLTSTPFVQDPTATVPNRRIYLDAGTYNWFIEYNGLSSFDSGRQNNQYPHLCYTGWYTWYDQLQPNNGYYVERSTLVPDNGCSYYEQTFGGWDVKYTQQYGWGSGLVPQF